MRAIQFLLVGVLGMLLVACGRTAPVETSAPTVTATLLPPTPAPTIPPTQAPEVTPEASPTAAPISTLDPAVGAAVDRYLATVFDGQPFSGAVLVAQGNTVLLRKGYGLADREQGIPNTPETRFRLGSVTKPFTALAMLLLVEAGQVDVGAPVCLYLAECPAAWGEITVEQVLAHTAGIPDLTRFPDFEATKGEPATPEELLARFMDRPLDFPPGTRWQYSNSGYLVLGAVIEQVTGQAYAAFMQAQVFAPLGMQATGYDHNLDTLAVGYTPAGSQADYIDMSIPYAAGALYSTVMDLYRWDRALARGELLSPGLRDAMFTIHVPLEPGNPSVGYGYGWIVRDTPAGKIVEHNGQIEGFSAGIRRYLGEDAVIIVLSNEQARHIAAVIDGLEAIVLRGSVAP